MCFHNIGDETIFATIGTDNIMKIFTLSLQKKGDYKLSHF